MVYTYSGIIFSLKKTEVLTHVTIWIDLVDIMLSEISQSQNDKYGRFHLREILRGVKFIKTESRRVEAWG